MESSKRKARVQRRRQAQRRARLQAILFVAAGAIVIAGFLIWPSLTPAGNVFTAPPRDYSLANGNGLGDPNAPIVIEEFSDYQCTHCETFFNETEETLIEQYVATGKVYLIYRSMGAFLGPESQAAAEATYCAGDQGQFWQYHDIVFRNYSTGNSDGYADRRLIAFADTLGLDTSEFRSCLSDNKYLDQVQQDQLDGIQYGITGTPSFVFNGQLTLEGAQPFSVFQQTIDAMLAQTSTED